MTKRRVTNVSASVRALLLNIAKNQNSPYNELLRYYTMERFLYRLSKSPFAGDFVLKGALMFKLWGLARGRSTKDIDLLSLKKHSLEELAEIMNICLCQEVTEDGVRFETGSIAISEIRIQDRYRGARVRFLAFVGTARIHMQIDIGLGDVVVPRPQESTYPTLLDFAKPHLLSYTQESLVAEKVHTMVVREMANTRMKDFYDILTLAQFSDFEGEVLAEGMRATFHRRGTTLPKVVPVALTERFSQDSAKQAQWKVFLRKGRLSTEIVSLDKVIAALREFIMPALTAAEEDTHFILKWPAGGPWQPR